MVRHSLADRSNALDALAREELGIGAVEKDVFCDKIEGVREVPSW